MSGNASRYSHQRDRRFSQLILSQGAMVTDADQREGMAIGLRNTTALGGTSIRTGVPQTDGIVTWEEVEEPSAHKIMTGIRPGKVVADGHVGEVRLQEGEESEGEPGLGLLFKQQDLLEFKEEIGDDAYALYADLWHRFVGPSEDGRLVDPAFLSAETSTRTQMMAQLKLARLEDDVPDADLAAHVQNEGLPIYGDFRLTEVEFANEVVEPDDCDPCATTLEDPNQDAGNSNFRLEVHSSAYNTANLLEASVPAHVPENSTVTLKWSHDNGSTEVPIAAADSLLNDSSFDTAVFELTTRAGEQRLGLYTDGMTDRLATLHARADIEAAIAGAPSDAFLRVWDGAVRIDLNAGDLAVEPIGTLSAEGSVDDGDTWTLQIALGGLNLTLVAQEIETVPYMLPGDAWSVEIREYATEDGDKLIWQPEPVEIEHHYAFVGFIRGGEFRNEEQPDMRARAFPALTELDALDIAYDNARSKADAWTVQGALDLLFDRPIGEGDGHDCHCTYCIDPEADLADQLNEIAGDIAQNQIQHALICIPAGRHFLRTPVLFRGGQSITIRGAGRELTVIELANVPPDLGALNFFGLATVRLEEMAFIGEMSVSDQKARSWVVGVHDVYGFEALRVAVEVAREDDGLSHGILFQPVELSQPRTKAQIRECLFRIGANAQGIANWRGLTHLNVENSIFRSSNIDTFGGLGKLNASNDLVARTSVSRRTPEREAQIRDGFFANYTGNSELLLNFTDIPPEAREAASQYWSRALRMMEGQGRIAEPAEFEKVQKGLKVINRASGYVIEAEVQIADKAGVAEGGFTFGGNRLPLATALIGAGGTSNFVGMETGGGADRFGAVTSILVAGGSLRTDDAEEETTSASDDQILKVINAADGVLARGVSVADFAGGLAGVLDSLAQAGQKGPPNWGIFSFSDRAIPAKIMCNTFSDVDVAIDLVALPTNPQTAGDDPHSTANIHDNTVRRIFRGTRVFPPEFGEGANENFRGRQPITLSNYEDMTIENNSIGQFKPADLDEKEYEQIFDFEYPDEMASFSAITLRGQLGHKVRCIGNTASNMRHCVYVNGFPLRFQTNLDSHPINFWVFKENSSMPQVFGDRAQPAVEFSPVFDGALQLIKLCISDNWLPNNKFEK